MGGVLFSSDGYPNIHRQDVCAYFEVVVKTMNEPSVVPEWVSVMPDYTNLTVSYHTYQMGMVTLVVFLLFLIVFVGVLGWWLSASLQKVKLFDVHKLAQRIRDRPKVEVEVGGPDLSKSVVLYRGTMPVNWWSANGVDFVDAPLGKCSYIPFIIDGMINPLSHAIVYSNHPFGEADGRKVLKAHHNGQMIGKMWGIDTFPTRRGVWCMPFSIRRGQS